MFGAILGGAGLLAGLAGGQKSSRAAERAGRANAENIEKETAEAVRRAELQLQSQTGTAIASMAASGVRGGTGGTTQAYLGALEQANKDEISWLEESGKSRARAARMGAQQAADAAKMNSYTSFIGGFGDLAMSNTGTELMSKWGWI